MVALDISVCRSSVRAIEDEPFQGIASNLPLNSGSRFTTALGLVRYPSRRVCFGAFVAPVVPFSILTSFMVYIFNNVVINVMLLLR
jgi:hypothetical protein